MLPTSAAGAENGGSGGAAASRPNSLKPHWPPWRRQSLPRSAESDGLEGTYIPLTDFRSSVPSPSPKVASNLTRLVPASPAHARPTQMSPSLSSSTASTTTTTTSTPTSKQPTTPTEAEGSESSSLSASSSSSSFSSAMTAGATAVYLQDPFPRPPPSVALPQQRQDSRLRGIQDDTPVPSLPLRHRALSGVSHSSSTSEDMPSTHTSNNMNERRTDNSTTQTASATWEQTAEDGPTPVPGKQLSTRREPKGDDDDGRNDAKNDGWPRRLARRQYSDSSMQEPVGEYMRGIAAEARSWSARALDPPGNGREGSWGGGGGRSGGSSGAPKKGGGLDPVAMLLLPEAGEKRVGGPSGRGPLLRRLQRPVDGMLDDFVLVTITRPGQLYVRLKPDPRGLVVVNNFDKVPDDPETGCPRLGPVEIVGSVMPGDALASVNRDMLLGRPFAECVKCIRDASATATVAEPCLLCFRKADPMTLKADALAARPRSLEQEKRRSLKLLLLGGKDGMLDEVRLRGITSTGVPDAGGLRPVLWRLLLSCLPLNRRQWTQHLQRQRDLYAHFVNDLILKPAEKVTQGGGFDLKGASLLHDLKSDKLMPGSEEALGRTAGSEAAADTPAVKTNGEVGTSPEGDAARDRRAYARDDLPVHGKSETLEGAISDPRATAVASAEAASATTTTGKSPSSAALVIAAERPRSGRRTSGNQGLRPTDDDPLSDKESSGWAALWSDKELMQAIEQDVVRTMPDLAFYAGGGGGGNEDENESNQSNGKIDNVSPGKEKLRGEKHRPGRERRLAIARILFVHAKLNPAESYTQGMNEIVATLYFVMASDPHEEWSRHAEADSFFSFTNLMAEIRDVFIQSLDDSESGLQGRMEAFARTLHQHDPELATHMENLALDPRYFALRWFTTLLCREFDLPDTIRLWDSLFASRDRSAFLVFLFVTLLLAQREALLAGDFASNLQLLQAYPPTDVPEILARSEALRLFSARGDAARAGALKEQRAREAAEGAKAAAEQVNAAARRLWNAATDFATEVAAGAAETMERMTTVSEGQGSLDRSVSSSSGRGFGGEFIAETDAVFLSR